MPLTRAKCDSLARGPRAQSHICRVLHGLVAPPLSYESVGSYVVEAGSPGRGLSGRGLLVRSATILLWQPHVIHLSGTTPHAHPIEQVARTRRLGSRFFVVNGDGPQTSKTGRRYSLEAELGSQSGESGDELPAKPVGIKQPGSAVSAGSDKMQVVQPVIMPLARHRSLCVAARVPRVSTSPAYAGNFP